MPGVGSQVYRTYSLQGQMLDFARPLVEAPDQPAHRIQPRRRPSSASGAGRPGRRRPCRSRQPQQQPSLPRYCPSGSLSDAGGRRRQTASRAWWCEARTARWWCTAARRRRPSPSMRASAQPPRSTTSTPSSSPARWPPSLMGSTAQSSPIWADGQRQVVFDDGRGPASEPPMSPTERARTAGIIPRFGAELFERASKVAGAL